MWNKTRQLLLILAISFGMNEDGKLEYSAYDEWILKELQIYTVS